PLRQLARTRLQLQLVGGEAKRVHEGLSSRLGSGLKTAMCSLRPRTSTVPSEVKAKRASQASRVLCDTRMRVPYSLFNASSRAARLTVLPSSVKDIRLPAPTEPPITGPVLMPMRVAS